MTVVVGFSTSPSELIKSLRREVMCLQESTSPTAKTLQLLGFIV